MSLGVNMNTKTKQPIPKYTLEFKKDAARLVNETIPTSKRRIVWVFP